MFLPNPNGAVATTARGGRSASRCDLARRAGPGLTNVRAQRKAETQERIVAAALALFSERGYDGASISAIAEQAHVSRATVFWHFGDKEGLFRETFRRMLIPFFEEVQQSIGASPPRRRVIELLEAYERVVEENEASIRTIVRWLFESEHLRSALLETLFALHDGLIGRLAEAVREMGDPGDKSWETSAGLVALLDGNLLLALLDPTERNRELRRAGLRHLARLAVGGLDG